MSKSLKRVRAALDTAGLTPTIVETRQSRTAVEAAHSVDCEVDQIVKSIVFKGETSQQAILFLTAGGNQIDAAKATALAGEPLVKADAALIRSQTGFAIGGVSPIGHLNPIRVFMDPRLNDFSTIWAAAGTPRHVFSAAPDEIRTSSGAVLANFVMNG
ncbi:YbaK/EbsC family protein [Aliisedimentitalea scapharcae]|uniref:YbaK/EbsC family protein n=1 Tax=Aliisedimentitalea scapharcae TaxID=1524259 RepID=A0ABZ2XS62_9RHOB